jgi:transposase-like protein
MAEHICEIPFDYKVFRFKCQTCKKVWVRLFTQSGSGDKNDDGLLTDSSIIFVCSEYMQIRETVRRVGYQHKTSVSRKHINIKEALDDPKS